ncbi:glycosyltransferase family 2 protein [Christensenellaceae bacterium OttesenSCG-928-K19]|nr:glycosyltransferase family 2 protein [Christensenellaceae bacterium OttesenSCG-928-K19]
MKYDVTVGIVNYNDYIRTREAVRSILEQTRGVKIKIYVIDNASSDGSAERIANEFSAISIIFCDRNLGYGAANNLVIGLVDSDYHAVVNPDIVLRSDALKELYDFMQENKDVGLCIPAIHYLNGDPQHLPMRDPKLKYLIARRLPLKRLEKHRRHYCMLDENLSEVTDIEFASGCFMFARTALLKETGGFDERYFLYFEDADLSRTIRKRARVVCVPSVKVYHDYMRTSAKKLKYLSIHILSMFKYFLKWRKDDKTCAMNNEKLGVTK